MDPTVDNKGSVIPPNEEHLINNGANSKRPKFDDAQTKTNDVDMITSDGKSSDPATGDGLIWDAASSDNLSSLFAGMPDLPGSRRRDDEYILVRQTGPDTFVGTVKAKLDYLPTKAEFNASCRLYRDGAGNYYPPPLAFDKIDVPEQLNADWHGLQPPERDRLRFHYKLDVWNRAHEQMGITGTRIFYETDKNIPLDRNYRLKPEHKYVETKKYGRREIQKRYENEFQAGSLLPDILIKTPENDIHFVYRFAGDKYANKTFAQFEHSVKNTFGNNAEIKLKSKSGIMHDSKYLESWEHGSADIRFAEFAGENRAHNKQLPLATVNMGRQPDGNGGLTSDRHVSVEFLLQNASGTPWAHALKKGELWDRVQVLARDGNRYITPPRLQYSDPEHFTQLMNRVGLPVSMGLQSHAESIKFEQLDAKPAVLVASSPELRECRDIAQERWREVIDKQVLIADRNEKGQRTGTYTSALEYKRMMLKLPEDAAQMLGKPADEYSREFVRPEPATRPIYDHRASYESRPRGQTVNSL